MKVQASVKKRSADCIIVKRKGRVYVINKKNPNLHLRHWTFTVQGNPEQSRCRTCQESPRLDRRRAEDCP